MAQTSYGEMLPAFAGMKADAGYDRVESYAAEEEILFGRGVALGTDPEKQILVMASGATFVGASLHIHKVTGKYAVGEAVNVLRKGVIYVDYDPTARDVGGVTPAPGGPVYVNYSGSNKGKFRGDDGHSTTPFASLVDGAVFKSAPNAQNLVKVELNLPA